MFSTTEEFAVLMRERFGVAELSFNANLRLKAGEDESKDPTAEIFEAEEIAARLGGVNVRGGVWLVYEDRNDPSRWWLETDTRPRRAGVVDLFDPAELRTSCGGPRASRGS